MVLSIPWHQSARQTRCALVLTSLTHRYQRMMAVRRRAAHPCITATVVKGGRNGRRGQPIIRRFRYAIATKRVTPRYDRQHVENQEDRNGSNPLARPSRFQSGPARRHRLEAIPGVPTFGATRGRCRSALGARPVRDQGQSALRREVDATHTQRTEFTRSCPGFSTLAWAISSTATR